MDYAQLPTGARLCLENSRDLTPNGAYGMRITDSVNMPDHFHIASVIEYGITGKEGNTADLLNFFQKPPH
jgi:hypothetical protein